MAARDGHGSLRLERLRRRGVRLHAAGGRRAPRGDVLRIALFAKRKPRTRTTRGIAAALARAGHGVLLVNERGWRRWLGAGLARASVLRQVERFAPDLVLVHADDVENATLEALAPGRRSALFTPDCWPEPLSGRTLELARRVDLLLTVARGQVRAFEAAGVRRAAWLPEACDPALHHPVGAAPERFHSDVAFIGKANAHLPEQARRRQLVRGVAQRFETKLYGSGWETLGLRATRKQIGPADYRRVCRGARIVLGRDWNDACDGYFSNRTWLTLSCGGFLLTNHVPGIEEIFGNHEELVWYRSDAECFELIEHYLKRPDERRRIAAAGRAFALSHRSVDHFARDLVDLVEGRPLAFPPPRESAS